MQGKALPAHDRAIIVNAPAGDLIAAGGKTALVKAQRYRLEDLTLLVVQNRRAIGTIRVARPTVLNAEAFGGERPGHRVSEADRIRLWPGKNIFYLYQITEYNPIAEPVRVQHPAGPWLLRSGTVCAT